MISLTGLISRRSLVLVLCACFYSVAALNSRPIIGIVSEKLYSSDSSYIAASYVKFIESSGGRVVPIFSSSTDAEIKALFSSVNGVLFPGGAVPLNGSEYGHVGSMVLNLAKEANDKGEHFPVWGTCLGFELLAYLEADMGNSVLTSVDASNLPLALSFTKDAANSGVYSLFSAELMDKVATEKITFNSHNWGVTTKTFNNSKLKDFYKVLSTNKDRNGVEFVSSMEAFKYPFYGVQWHPEKNGFEWTTKEAIPHSEHAVAVMQAVGDFLVQEACKNDHRFPSAADEEKALIYQYTPVYTGDHSNFTQAYIFPK